MNPRSGYRLVVVAAAAALIALLYHELPNAFPLLQRVAQYLFFLPIVMAGLWFGWRGGVAMAFVCALLYLPRLLTWWRDTPNYGADQIAEAVDLLLVGSVFGVLADRERRRTRVLERAAAELEQSLDHLKRAERLSGVGQLAANLAHEIRNPLASIEGAAALLEDPGGLSEEQRAEFIGIVKAESRRLSRLLTDMLDYAKPRSPDFRPIEIPPLVESVINLVSSTAARQQVALTAEFAPGLGTAECDSGQIMQVVLNLLINALQAMPGGGSLRVHCLARGPDTVIEVRDQGPGIPPEEMEKLFSPFYTTKKDGTGLGLAIAQQIAVRHGGEIAVGPNRPCGAVFSLIFPSRRKTSLT